MGILKYHIRHIYRHFYYKFHERKNIIYLLFLLFSLYSILFSCDTIRVDKTNAIISNKEVSHRHANDNGRITL